MVFWTRVNPLSATFCSLLGGFLFYVGVYTIWLKRSTLQNIVIGGPPGRSRRWWAGRGDRIDRPRGSDPVRHHLLLTLPHGRSP
ncbi:MAG: hypothetical protein R2882_05780 [Gemmatimonadales bacterium]